MRNRIVIYTAVFGDYDDLKNPPAGIEGCDFVCYTDNRELKSDIYDIRILDVKGGDFTRKNRMVKLLPHRFFPEYECSLYHDASVSIVRTELKEFIEHYLSSHDWAVFGHAKRNCLYEELNACIERKKESERKMRRQIACYRKQGYPEQNGLTENGVLIRRHNHPIIMNFGEKWWEEIKRHSSRDQLSFAYLAWKEKLSYALLPGSIWHNEYFAVHDHKKKKKKSLGRKLEKSIQRAFRRFS